MQDMTEYAEVVLVTKQSPDIVKRLRHQYKKWHLSLTREMDRKIWDTHHIIGLSLGGSNNRDNLVVMNREEHAKLHSKYIDPQVFGMYEDEERLILLPKSYDMQSKSFKNYVKFFELMKLKRVPTFQTLQNLQNIYEKQNLR